jgi:hypothetical protein
MSAGASLAAGAAQAVPAAIKRAQAAAAVRRRIGFLLG